MGKSPIRKQVFLIFFFALFILVARLFYPFLTVLLWSGLLYAFLDPIYLKIVGAPALGQKRPILHSVTAGIMALLGVALLIVPLVFLTIAVMRQLIDIAHDTINFIDVNANLLDLSPQSPIGGFLFNISGGAINLSNLHIIEEIKSFLFSGSRNIFSYSGAIAKNLTALLVALAFMVFTLFFFLVDGRYLVTVLIGAIPIEKRYTSLFLHKMKDTGKHLIKGFFLVALYQALAMLIICSIFGIKSSLVIAALTAIASFIPMVGTALIWAPLTLTLAMSAPLWKTILFAAMCAFFVSTVDNFLRPLLLGDKLRIHPLLIFFSIVGGIHLFKFNGLILGPLILIVFFSAVNLYDQMEPDKDDTA